MIDNVDFAEPFRQAMLRAERLADAMCVDVITCEGRKGTTCAGKAWYDITHLFDPQQYSAELIAQHQDCLDHGIERRLIQRREGAQAILVKLTRRRVPA